MGEFNAGKSTLLNALLGQDLLKVHVLPTTASVTMLRRGKPGTVLAHAKNNEVRKWPMSKLNWLSAEGDEEAASVRESISHIEVPLECELILPPRNVSHS